MMIEVSDYVDVEENAIAEVGRCGGDSMRKAKKKDTAGQKLMRIWENAFKFDREGEKIAVPPNASRLDPGRATQRWYKGMAGAWCRKFAVRLCELRVKLGLTQQMLAMMAGLTETAIIRAEGGGWIPDFEAASRMCRALDEAPGVTMENLG